MSTELSGALSGAINDFLEGSIAGQIKVLGGSPNLKSLSAFANGEYLPPEGYDGFDSVIVDVPIKEEVIGNITENGTHTPPEGKVYKEVVVNVPAPDSVTGTFTENGTFTPPTGKLYNEVVVNVPAPEPETYFNLQNRLYIESSMNFANVTYNKFDSVWNGGGSVGFSLNGIVNLRGKSKVIVDVDNIGTSYGSGQVARFNFNFGLLNQIFATYVLLESNTAGKLISYGIAPYSDYHDQSYHGELTIPDQDCYLYVACNGVNAQGISVKVI